MLILWLQELFFVRLFLLFSRIVFFPPGGLSDLRKDLVQQDMLPTWSRFHSAFRIGPWPRSPWTGTRACGAGSWGLMFGSLTNQLFILPKQSSPKVLLILVLLLDPSIHFNPLCFSFPNANSLGTSSPKNKPPVDGG